MEPNASLKKYTLLVACGASFLTPFTGSAINLAIPSIGKEFGSSALLLGWVATSYLLASAAFLVPFGRLADIVGRKKIFILGISLFGLFSGLCGFAWSIESLIAFRVLQGIGSAMIFGTSMAILTSVFPPQERGKVLGISVATVYTGLSLGPVLGGIMNHNLGWPSIFYFTAVIALAVFLFTVWKLEGEWAGARGEKFDLMGSILYSVGLVSFMYGISSVDSSVWAKYILLVGLVVLIAFVKYEMKVKQPVLNLSLFSKNLTFAFSNLAALINYSATFALGFLLSMYLQVVLGYNSQTAGLILLSQPVIMAILSPFAGTLSDRVDPRLVSSWGMSITTLGLFIFCFLSKTTPIWLLILNLGLLGIGFALFSSPNTNSVMGSVEKRFYGVASSTLGTMRLTGQTISMAIVTLLLTIYVGNVKLSETSADMLIKGTKIAFIVFTIMCFGGIFASLARGSVKTNAQRYDQK
ncbi:major facilitator superfamily MFS_1 [Desulforamulus reducens MI-1]|uniref:Major facilitator superfamily MFS_1 n=1 Tax=Desulforamulus reducens (strain ATCC BAA-1160 / DSM 100696 / MI-1) TaxID=349161 RepID=A4J238_DESRM|nr:MFS transporter [Desulforamulus reducens]ABO49141.1 major facilitator superfamily MFS_1 [Desulforamulus reducens MI-1]